MIHIVLLLAVLALIALLALTWRPRAAPSPEGLLSAESLRATFAMTLAGWQAHVGALVTAGKAARSAASALGDTLMERPDPATVVATRPVYQRSTARPDAVVVVIISRPKPEGVDSAVVMDAIRRTAGAMLPAFVVTGTHQDLEESLSVEFMVTENR